MDSPAAAEMEAMLAIFGEDLVQTGPGAFELFIAPECDASQIAGSVVLTMVQPAGYPLSAPADVRVAGTSAAGHAFEHRGGAWELSGEHASALRSLIDSALAAAAGEPVCFEVASVVRTYLSEHTVAEKPPAAPGADEEEDVGLDESDMDEEMIDALRDVLRDSGPLIPQLDKAERLPAGSAEQRAALHAIWLGLTDAQRREMVASDDEDESEDDDDDDDSEEDVRAQPPTPRAASGPAGKGAAPPPAAARTCPKGHALTAVVSKPHDYRRLAGGEGNCDVCDADFRYSAGGYHCDRCTDWDCCVRCGGAAADGDGAARQAHKTSSKNGKGRSNKR